MKNNITCRHKTVNWPINVYSLPPLPLLFYEMWSVSFSIIYTGDLRLDNNKIAG